MKRNKKIGVRPYLTTVTLSPENQETPINFVRKWYTPEKLFYRRNHFPYPLLPKQAYFLSIEGHVNNPVIFSYQDLLQMPTKTVVMLQECSGNKRSFFKPKVYGEQWTHGAISQAEWKGVSLRDLLSHAKLKKDTKEIVFEGYDHGTRPNLEGEFNFGRSLPVEKALDPDTIIAYEMNGEPIPYKHGYPFRLIVPGWYGMASVKWLKRIIATERQFKGPFQSVDYVYYPNKENDIGKKPVTTIHVNSTIQQPLNYQVLDEGTIRVKGIAWSGTGTIEKVEVSTDNGTTWEIAELQKDTRHPYSWSFWNYDWNVNKKGEYSIMTRATDSNGNSQPYEEYWNRKGYGYNAIYPIHIKIE